MLNIVLYEPEIPHNTGAVGRLCVGLGARLHLIEPLGFRMTDSAVKRCGLDYWEHLDCRVYMNWGVFLESEVPAELVFFTRHVDKNLYETSYPDGVYLVFGSESRGLPRSLHEQYADRMRCIPMPGEYARSINLANAVAIAAYEAYRQMHSTA